MDANEILQRIILDPKIALDNLLKAAIDYTRAIEAKDKPYPKTEHIIRR